jgi:hypothetical protein
MRCLTALTEGSVRKVHVNRRVTQLLQGRWRSHFSFFFRHDSHDTGSCLGVRFRGSGSSGPPLRFIMDGCSWDERTNLQTIWVEVVDPPPARTSAEPPIYCRPLEDAEKTTNRQDIRPFLRFLIEILIRKIPVISFPPDQAHRPHTMSISSQTSSDLKPPSEYT